MTETAQSFDIVIIGAGPAGLSFARTLSDTGLNICLVERHPLKVLENPPEDGRDIALTHTSEKLMKELGLWAHIPEDEIGVIRDAKVIDGVDPYALHFDSNETGAPYLGKIVPNHLIRKAAYEAVKDLGNITILTDKNVMQVETDNAEGRVTLKDGSVEPPPHGDLGADDRFRSHRDRLRDEP
ncbi:MAG: FAD-dependent monooxygenase [Maritimibacter sp.]